MHDKATPKSHALLMRLQDDYPELTFLQAGRFSWHAGKRRISYTEASLRDISGTWALLHELGHALLKHTDYTSDLELLHIEVAAWDKARALAIHYGLSIEEDYIQDSLDSYRDWLHIRSTCPTCRERCLQVDMHTYSCHNCGTTWYVTQSRLCRPYRKTYKKSLK